MDSLRLQMVQTLSLVSVLPLKPFRSRSRTAIFPFQDHFVVRLVFIANLVKVMMTFRPPSEVKPEEIHPEEEKAVNRLSKQVSEVSGIHQVMNMAGQTGNISALTLAQTVKSR